MIRIFILIVLLTLIVGLIINNIKTDQHIQYDSYIQYVDPHYLYFYTEEGQRKVDTFEMPLLEYYQGSAKFINQKTWDQDSAYGVKPKESVTREGVKKK